MLAEIILTGWMEVIFYGLIIIIGLEILLVDIPRCVLWILDKIEERRTKKEIEMDSIIYHEWFEEHQEELFQKFLKDIEEKKKDEGVNRKAKETGESSGQRTE